MTELLVSVRCAVEAEAALQAGAGLIDVKEPRHGSLGRASVQVITAVCERVGNRAPVSAALGELLDGQAAFARSLSFAAKPVVGVRFVKWGLAGSVHHGDWREDLAKAATSVCGRTRHCQPVAVAYADWQQAQSPHPEEVAAFACARRWVALLLDTWAKNGKNLLDWVSLSEIEVLCRRCHDAGVRVALAGSLRRHDIIRLKSLEPNWFAVRGAACGDGERAGTIDPSRVRDLVSLIQGSTPES